MLIHEAVAEAAPLQIDLAGAIEVGDWDTAGFVTDRLLGFVVQALLASHGNTNPSEKWRWRKLRTLDDKISRCPMLGGTLAPSAYSLLTQLRLAVTLEPSSSVERARQVVHLANRVLPTCQARLAEHRIGDTTSATMAMVEGADGVERRQKLSSEAVLPELPLDFGIRLIEGDYHAYRIMGDVDFTLNQLAVEALLGFDGKNTKSGLVERLVGLTDADRPSLEQSIDGLLALLRSYGVVPSAVEKALIDLEILSR